MKTAASYGFRLLCVIITVLEKLKSPKMDKSVGDSTAIWFSEQKAEGRQITGPRGSSFPAVVNNSLKEQSSVQ